VSELRTAGSPDVPTLVAGMVILALGAVLLLDRLGVLDLRFDTVAPIACAAVGAILLATGLSRRGSPGEPPAG
jgi:hypothetical protein